MNNDELNKLRDQIDKIDTQMIGLLSKRGDVVRKIGQLKRENNLELFDPERKMKVTETWIKKAKAAKRLIAENNAANLVNKPKIIKIEQTPSAIKAKSKLAVDPIPTGSGKCCCIWEKFTNFSMP